MSDDRHQLSALDRFKRNGQALAEAQPMTYAQQVRPGAPAMPGEYRGPELVREAPGFPEGLEEFEPEIEELKSYGLARGKAGQVLMLELRKRSGDAEGVPYAYINRVRFSPSGEIHIFTGGDVIVIEGNNLSQVFQGLMRHSLVYVQELSRGHDQVGEGEPFVEGIRVEVMED